MEEHKFDSLNHREFDDYLEEEWSECARCPLHETRIGSPVFGTGSLKKPSIMFVGQAPGSEEERQGVPFVGPTGELAQQFMWMLDMPERDDPGDNYRWTNVVMCRPPDYDRPEKDRAPDPPEISACKPRLLEEIYAADPHLIVALGAVASKTLGGSSCTLKAYLGQELEVKIPSRVKGDLHYPMTVTRHPAFLLRTQDYRKGFPVIDNWMSVFFTSDKYKQQVGHFARAWGVIEYLQCLYSGERDLPESVKDLIQALRRRA